MSGELRLRSRAAAAPVVSVIVTTRNHAATLPDTMTALLQQEFGAEYEVIVCDNKSPDATREIMESLVRTTSVPLTYIRLAADQGPAGGRNRGLDEGRGRYVAFTDSDCMPQPGWLTSMVRGLEQPGVGIVQGRTVAAQHPVPLFEHHVETSSIDGTFATANVAYRREAIGQLRFDSRCWYWEDVDLGWRVIAKGWQALYAADAIVAHAVIEQSALAWLLWSTRRRNLPAIVARYPDFRRHLFLGLWAQQINPLLELAVLGLILSPWQLASLGLTIPYLVAFGRSRGLAGRFPPAKAAAYVARDLVSVGSLVASSVRHRALVL